MGKSHVEVPHPLYGRVDLTGIQDVLHSPPVQRLMRVKQLGGVYFIHPLATHTRLIHSIGVYALTKMRLANWTSRNRLSDYACRLLEVAALVHDVGHRPFSHLLEPLCGDHKVNTYRIIREELSSYCKQAGVCSEDVVRVLAGESKVGSIITANPLGTDKIDYLTLDPSQSCGGSPNLTDLVAAHVGWNDEVGLYALSKGEISLVSAIRHSWEMYAEVYERTSARVLQRYLQELLRLMRDLDLFVSSQLEDGGEDSVMGGIGYWASKNPDHECAERYNRLMLRVHPKKTLIFCTSPQLQPLRDKPTMAIIECDQSLIDRATKWTLDQLAAIEIKIAQCLSLKPTQVSVSAPPPARRWQVPEALIAVNGGGICKIGDVFTSLHPTASNYQKIVSSLVVAIDQDYRLSVIADSSARKTVEEVLNNA